MMKSQHWFRYWLCAEQVTSHYLNKCLPEFVSQDPVGIIGSGNGLLLKRSQAITWTNADLVGCYLYVYIISSQWGRVTHICVSKQTIIGSYNGLSPGRRQAITWTNAGILLIRPLGTKFNEILIQIHTFSFKEMHLKMLSGKWRPFCLGLNVLTAYLYGFICCILPISFRVAAVTLKNIDKINHNQTTTNQE